MRGLTPEEQQSLLRGPSFQPAGTVIAEGNQPWEQAAKLAKETVPQLPADMPDMPHVFDKIDVPGLHTADPSELTKDADIGMQLFGREGGLLHNFISGPVGDNLRSAMQAPVTDS